MLHIDPFPIPYLAFLGEVGGVPGVEAAGDVHDLRKAFAGKQAGGAAGAHARGAHDGERYTARKLTQTQRQLAEGDMSGARHVTRRVFASLSDVEHLDFASVQSLGCAAHGELRQLRLSQLLRFGRRHESRNVIQPDTASRAHRVQTLVFSVGDENERSARGHEETKARGELI